MDDIVKPPLWQNGLKCHNCYGWLALDARGQWRMRDDRAQALNLPAIRYAISAFSTVH